MSTNKNAILRYKILDKCFSNSGKRYYINDLVDACNAALLEFDPLTEGVKKRQVYDDIRFMESEQGWAIPLERVKDGRRTYLRYEDYNFSINNQPINAEESEQLKSAMMVLSRFKGMPQFEWVNELLPKLDQSFNITSHSGEIMKFESNEFLEGLEYLSPLFKAIQFRQAIEVEYKTFKSTEINKLAFHPYYLKQHNNRWFLIGKQDDYDGITNLALDRIKEVSHSSKTFDHSKMRDFEEYFEDIIGVSVPEDGLIEKIELKVTAKLAPYIVTKPLHGSQKKKEETETYTKFTIEVIPNFELEKLILSFGEDVEVIKPSYFRDKINLRIALSYNNYN